MKEILVDRLLFLDRSGRYGLRIHESVLRLREVCVSVMQITDAALRPV